MQEKFGIKMEQQWTGCPDLQPQIEFGDEQEIEEIAEMVNLQQGNEDSDLVLMDIIYQVYPIGNWF